MPRKLTKPAQSTIITDFERMSDRMRDTLQTLEQRVITRTRDLETAADVSREVATTLDLGVLLPRLVNLTKSRFKLYHTHVYLLDPDGQFLVMEAGYGKAGKAMKKAGHRIAINAPRSIVARAARDREAVVVNNTLVDDSFLPNPLLPKTRAELAVPLVAGQHILGVLDVQSDKADRFEQDDVGVLTTLASQVAVAVENARAFTNLRQAQSDLSRIYTMSVDMLGAADREGRFTQVNDAWQATLGYNSSELLAKPYLDLVHPDDRQLTTDELSRDIHGRQTISFENRCRAKDGSYRWLAWNARPDSGSGLVYFVARDVTESKNAEQQLRDALSRVETLFRANQALLRAATLDELLRAFTGPIASAAPFRATLYSIEPPEGDAQPEWAQLVSAFQTYGEQSPPPGLRIQLSKSPIGHLILDSPGTIMTIPDVDHAEDLLDESLKQVFQRTGAKTLLSLPLLAGSGKWLAIVVLSWPELFELKPDLLELYEVLTPQLSTALENRLLLEQTARQARDLAIAAEVSAETNTILDLSQMLHTVVELTKERFELYHVHVYVLDEESRSLRLSAGAGEPGRQMIALGHSIPLDAARSIVARAARTGHVVTSNDVRADPDFLPNPLLPETRSEMSVPMLLGERVIGVLDSQSNHVRRFADADRAVHTILAAQIATAVSNARQYERSELRARDLATVAEVSAQASRSLVLGDLLVNVSNLVKDRFGLYHAHIYLLDDDTGSLNLAAGAGEAGQYMVSGKHAIPLNNELSIVAKAARSREPQIVNDVRTSPTFLPNPLLPDTHSEMAIPMLVGEQVVGVLDVQSELVNHFTTDDRLTQTTLAGQIAVAVVNASLFEETQIALAETEALYSGSEAVIRADNVEGVLTALIERTALSKYDRANFMMFDKPWADEQPATITVTAVWELSGEPSRAPAGTVYELDQFPFTKHVSRDSATIFENVQTDERMDDHIRGILSGLDTLALVTVPLVARDQWIGVLTAQSRVARAPDADELRRITTLIAQASSVIYVMRLLDEAQATAEQLRDVDRLKSEFLANMSHELRTPLNSIIGYSELLIDGVGQDLDEMSREDLEGIHSSGQYLLALINDILDLAKIEAGRLELSRTPVNLAEVVPSILEGVRVLLREKPGVELDARLPEDLPLVLADAVRLRQILWNLMSNAVKFTEQGHVRLFARAVEGRLEIGVEDTGIGISPQYHASIFDQFRQVDGSATRRAGGTGLGLAIIRQLVVMHGGDISVTSEPGKGSTFIVSLPVEMPAAHTAPETLADRSRPGNGKHRPGLAEKQRMSLSDG